VPKAGGRARMLKGALLHRAASIDAKTALRLAEVRGVVLLAAAQHGVEVHSYAPRLIKASVAGYGNADKRQLQRMVQSVLGLAEVPEPVDAADALAVALCHLQSEEFRQRFAIPLISSGSARRGRAAALSVAAVPRPTTSVRSSPARQAAPSQ